MTTTRRWAQVASGSLQDTGHRLRWSTRTAPEELRSRWTRRRSTTRAARPLIWIYRSTLQKSGLLMRGVQLRAMVDRHAHNRLETGYADETAIHDVRDSVIFMTRSFLADATIDELDTLRRRNNVICADYLDWPTRPELHRLVDVYIASSMAQYEFYRAKFPKKRVHHITHHADPAIVGIRGPVDFCSIGYFGEIGNAKYRREMQGLIGFTQTNNSEYPSRDWLWTLRHYNVHYSVRDWTFPTPGPKPGAFKPFTKGFNAAHCRSNIIVPVDESDAAHYLGADYPYLLHDDSLQGVRTMVEFVKESFRGPEWFEGLQTMAELSRRTSPVRIVQEVEDLVRTCP